MSARFKSQNLKFKIQPVIDEHGVWYVILKKRLFLWRPLGCSLYESFGEGEVIAYKTPQAAARQIRREFVNSAKIEDNRVGHFFWSLEE